MRESGGYIRAMPEYALVHGHDEVDGALVQLESALGHEQRVQPVRRRHVQTRQL